MVFRKSWRARDFPIQEYGPAYLVSAACSADDTSSLKREDLPMENGANAAGSATNSGLEYHRSGMNSLALG